MDNAEPPMFGISPPTPLSSSTTLWGADAALLAHPLFAGDVPPHLTRPVPPYTHAYVSFGTGTRQNARRMSTYSQLTTPWTTALCCITFHCACNFSDVLWSLSWPSDSFFPPLLSFCKKIS